MKATRYIFTILLFCSCFAGKCQCKFSWKVIASGKHASGDTVITNTSLHPNLEGKHLTLDFNELVDAIKIPRFSNELINSFQNKIDSLDALGTQEAKEESEFIQLELESKFQLINLDIIQVALYGVDTFFNDDVIVPIYLFATSFYEEWNEDFCNYFFYYTENYGVVVSTYACAWEFTWEHYSLINSCSYTKSDIVMKEKIVEYVLLNWKKFY